VSEASAAAEAVESKRRWTPWRFAQVAISLVIVVGIFVGVIPRIADYGEVWSTITAMTPIEGASLVGAMFLNLMTYWWQMMAAMPGLRFWQAAVNNQTGTSIANTLPGGGVLAVGVTTTMYRSWGFTFASIALVTVVTGVWNIFFKLGLPIVALALLAVTGQANTGLVVGAVIGLLVLAVAVVLFALMLRSQEFARRIGDGLARVVSAMLRPFRGGPVQGWGRAALTFRADTIELVSTRWIVITLTTILSQLSLFVVLLLALRHVGVSEQEVSTLRILAVYAFGRLVTALPITPGGLGVVELSYIGGLTVGTDVDRAAVTAAVLVFRALTYGIQIPLGAATYLIWRANTSWRKVPPDETEAERKLRAAVTA